MKLFIFLFLLSSTSVFAQNPILPEGVFMADPTAHVWNDGKLYIYGSVDESTEYYCSHRYHLLSTSDMLNWEVHENVFSSKGPDDKVDYNDKLLFAPDCMYRDGKWYLYYCQPDPENAEGVAVSDSPTGPFGKGKIMNTGKYSEIDPGVFIDDDGTAYYVWGQFSLKMAILKQNMCQIDTLSIKDNILTEEEHYFHEGAFMTKRNGLYYLVYADMSRTNTPSCLGYTTSTHPMGPYTYRGVIIDNDNSDPSNWNNHGSIAKFRDQWYVFYHRGTHNSRKIRKMCIEPIQFREDGSIPEVEMTTQGAGLPLSPYIPVKAERACLLFGNCRISLNPEGGEELTGITADDRIAFKYLDFDKGCDSVTVRLRTRGPAGKIVFSAGMPWRRPFATIDVPAQEESSEDWILLSAGTDNLTGNQALWVKFESESEDPVLDLDWFRFDQKEVEP